MQTRFSSQRRLLLVALLSIGLAVGWALSIATRYADAALLLARVGEPEASGGLFAWQATLVDESEADFIDRGEKIRARRYMPRSPKQPPGVVLLHGIHRLGIEEPRLVAFARALSASGIAVLTPELRELKDYRIQADSIPTIGAAAHALAGDEAIQPGGVTLMGFSFAGGLALLTAADPGYADKVKAVLAVGAHADLERVARFFATNDAIPPEGPPSRLRAHDYGALVLVYGHAAEFFREEDVAGAEEALRLWLWQEWDLARERAAALSTEGRLTIEQLFLGELSSISEDLLAFARRNEASMQAVSPTGKLGEVRAKVYLLHGAGDDVVPATETLWLLGELPEDARAAWLVSPAVRHVEPGGSATFLEQAKLVHFVKRLLDTLREAA